MFPGLERLKELQENYTQMLEEQKRIADKQAELAASGRKIAVRQGKLAVGMNRMAVANERTARATEGIKAAISATALNNFLRLAEECAKLRIENQILRGSPRPNNQRRRLPPPPEPASVSLDQILQVLNLPSSGEEADIMTISNSAVLVNRPEQGRAEQLINNPQFRQWMVEPKSTELLVHGHMKPSRTSISAISLFSASIVQSLRQDQRFCTLAFFCGEHSDPASDHLSGGVGLIKSLIAQLLTQYPFAEEDAEAAVQGVDPDLLSEDDIKHLCRLFVGLVRRVQNDVTVFCVLDSVNVYDDPDFLHGMGVERALFEVLSLTRDEEVQTDVKVLLTSPMATRTIWEAFGEEDVISMVGQPKGDKRFDGRRVGRQLEGVLDG